MLKSFAVIVCRIVKACRVAQHLAIENFHSVEVSSACIVFISVLGQDTSLLRLHLQVASQIAEYSADHIAVASSNHQSSTDNAESAYDPAATTRVCKCVILCVGVLFLVDFITVTRM